MVKPTVISTFAGCGGSSLGYQLAGFKELLAVEWDDNAVATFKLNFPDVPVYHGDICQLSGEECMRLAGIGPGELDVLDGSPPCQGFSTAGKRKFNDPRNSLFKEYARLLHELQPRVFVMENVTGMVKGVMKQAYLTIIAELRACGYRARGEVLNAMYFNVPQSRERVFIIGVREDLGIEPSHPKPQMKPVTMKQTLAGFDQSKSDVEPALLRSTWQMKRVLDGAEKQKHFGLVRTQWDRPCPTIVKDAGNTTTGMIHPDGARRLTIPELKRLASFGDEFCMVGGYKEQWQRIGNSVPPNLMRAIAEHIKTEILVR
jgi:DNA (cytosine-5)-methyltransferase 1